MARFLGTLRGRLILAVATVHALLMVLFLADLILRQQTLLLERQIEAATAGETLAAITRSGVAYALTAILLGSVIAWFLVGRFTRRLYAVQETIDAVRAGDPRARAALTGNDEAAGMAREFNAMLDALAEREAALRLSEQRYRSLLQKVQPAIVLHDGQGEVQNCNPLAAELLGLSADQLSGKPLVDPAWHFLRADGSVLPVAEYPVSQVLASGRPFRNQVMGIRPPDREEVTWVLVNAEPEYDEAGAITLVVVSFVDISERKLAEKSLAERVMLAELSADIGYSLSQPGDLRSILHRCVESLVRHLDVAFARIWTLNVADNVLELQASAGMYTRIDGAHCRVPMGTLKIGRIAEERQPHVTNAVIGDPRVHDQEWAKREGMVAFAGHPLTIGDTLVGVMAMFSKNQLTEVTIRALASVSNEIAIGIENKRGEESLHRLNRELMAISNCNQALMRAEDEQTLLQAICRIICDQAGYRMAWVGYAEHDAAKTIRPVAWAGVEEGYLAAAHLTWADTERGRGPSGTAIRTGESACIQDFSTDPHAAPWRESALQRGYRSSIALPLKDQNAITFGTLNIYAATANAFTPNEIRLLQELAGDLAFGIRVLQARSERTRVAEALAESEARLKEAQRIAHQGHWELDLQKGTLYWSDEVYRLFGLEPQEFGATYEAFLARVHPDDRGLVDRAYSESVRNKTGYDIEHRLVRKDGEIRYVNERCVTEYDGQGTPLRSLGTVLDITERKQAEEALNRLNAELEQRVSQRTAELEKKNRELERLNRLFVGRELRMLELKKRIKELEHEKTPPRER